MNERRRPRLVIVEGPDGAGKTTLVEKIERKAKAAGRHVSTYASGVPTRPPLKEYVNTAMTMWYEGSPLVIIDRYHIGEQVYGPVMRKGDMLGAIGREVLEMFLMELFVPTLVLALPPYEMCHDVWSQRIDDEYVKDTERYRKVYDLFCHVKTTLPTVKYDWTMANEDAFTRRVVS